MLHAALVDLDSSEPSLVAYGIVRTYAICIESDGFIVAFHTKS